VAVIGRAGQAHPFWAMLDRAGLGWILRIVLRTADVVLQATLCTDSQWAPTRLGDFFQKHDISDQPVLVHAWRVQLGAGPS
jgi:hypothetical protein